MSLSMKVVNRDKTQMFQTLQESKVSAAAMNAVPDEETASEAPDLNTAPKFAEDDVNGPGWVTFDKPVLYV